MKKVNYLGIEVESNVITSDDIDTLPLAVDDELDLVANLAMQELYMYYRERGGRFLHIYGGRWWAARAGYQILMTKLDEFNTLCAEKWKLIIRYLETEYQLR